MPKRYNTPHRSRVVKTRLSEDECLRFCFGNGGHRRSVCTGWDSCPVENLLHPLGLLHLQELRHCPLPGNAEYPCGCVGWRFGFLPVGHPAWHGSFSGSVSGRIQPGAAGWPAAHGSSQDHHPAGTKRHWQRGGPPHETDPVHLQRCWPYPQFALQAVMSMIPVNRKFLRGDIYYANLEPHLGSEQGGIRPVVVVQNNTANCYSPNLIVAPVTSNTAKKPDHQAHVLVDGNRAFLQPSMILAESVQTISKGRLIRPMGRLSIPELIRLNYALLYQLDLNEWVWRKEAYERYLRYHR